MVLSCISLTCFMSFVPIAEHGQGLIISNAFIADSN